jgi:uncharacterized radical SAM superfamily Fe-S cluster-containing enzyme
LARPDEPEADDAFAGDEEYAALQRALFVRLESFMDEQDIGDLYLADLLLDAAIHLRMSAYAAEVEKPSVAGLKLDLDRMRLDVEQMIRGAKKDAEGFIAEVKEARAAEAEEAAPESAS